MKKKKANLYLVEWLDSHYRAGWSNESAASNNSLRCFSVGWLAADGNDAIVLSANVSDEELPQRCGDITIPKVSIVKMRVLSPKNT
jgi:hypothetical protein